MLDKAAPDEAAAPHAPKGTCEAASRVVRQGVTVNDVVMPRSMWNGTSQTPV
jgi:hypothetical protein